MKAIMYHYVRPYNPIFPHFKNLDIEDFRKQLDYFDKEFGFVSIDDFKGAFIHNNVPKGIVLTFDDGLSCHYNYVFPELKKRGLWGLFYVNTFPYSNNKILDVHRTHLLLGKFDASDLCMHLNKIIDHSMLDQSKIDEFKKFTYSSQINDEHTLIFKRMTNYFIDYKHRTKVLDKLMSHYFPNESDLIDSFYLKKNQIKEMHDNGMIIGSHTVNHPVMSRLIEKNQKTEIIESFDFIEKITTNNEFRTFCYPYGAFIHLMTLRKNYLMKSIVCVHLM